MQFLNWIVINLKHRTDRIERLRTVFPNQEIERFDAIQHADPEIGCRESHLAVIRLAKERNYPWVLILEDDCDPYPEFQTSFSDICMYLWKHKSEWELYNGGPNPYSVRYRTNTGTSKLMDIANWISAQFIIVNSDAYDKLLAYNETKHPKKIDDYYSSCFKTITSSPMLTCQLDTYSDLAKSITNNGPLFERSRNLLRMF